MGRTSTSLNAVDKFADNWSAPPADSIANALKRANPSYRAAHFGKWQWPAPYTPDAMGYDVSDGAVRAAMTEDLDTNIGALLEKLDDLGIPESTYVIYMADNGMNSGILKGGKALLDEGGLRVPLIVSGPGISAHVYSDVTVVGYDLYPTVIDFVAPGFALPEGIEGGSTRDACRTDGARAGRH